jgi:hypothetical protein
MFYVIGQYWDFIILAMLAGTGIGWWSEGRKLAGPAETQPESTP